MADGYTGPSKLILRRRAERLAREQADRERDAREEAAEFAAVRTQMPIIPTEPQHPFSQLFNIPEEDKL